MVTKKAQGLSINTIILIILGVVVLVALIFGFTKGWDGIKQWIAPSNNIAEVKSQCDVACTTEDKYNYCFKKMELKADSKKINGLSCFGLSQINPEYGIGDCSSIFCDIYKDANAAKEYCLENKDDQDASLVTYIGLNPETNKPEVLTINCTYAQRDAEGLEKELLIAFYNQIQQKKE